MRLSRPIQLAVALALVTALPQVWADSAYYGFAYNVSMGLVPYRDFNMVVTPLYTFILSFFINVQSRISCWARIRGGVIHSTGER